VAAVGRAPGQRLRLVLAGGDAEADRQTVAAGEVLQAARALVADMVVMAGLAADHAAERDIAVELPRLRGELDRAGKLESPGHGHRLESRPGLGQRPLGAVPQEVADMRVIAGLDEKNVRRLRHVLASKSRAT